MKYQYANRMSKLTSSDVRELLKATQNKEIISIGGGLPAPEMFPIADIKKANEAVLDEMGSDALQYTTTEGYAPLRDWICKRMNGMLGTSIDQDNIILTNGSQQGLDLMGKVFLDAGDVVLCESPTYLSAISAFRAYECDFKEIPTDDEGMLMDALEQVLQNTPRVKFIYVIPTFQNPTGKTWTLERRIKLLELAKRYQVPIVEDNPYGEIRFEGEDVKAVAALDDSGLVIHLGTFSKTFCPGYRIGWIACAKELIEKFVLVKQGVDLQTNTFAQRAVYTYLQMFDLDAHVKKICALYKKRRDVAIQAVKTYFPDCVKFTKPQGGLFLWAELPKELNARDVLKECMKRNVAFVPGGSFYPNGGMENTMRINFSNMPEERLIKGLQVVAEVIKEML